MEQKIINFATVAASDLVKMAQLGGSTFVVDYDEENDVLYINFGKPQKADDAITGEDGVIRRKKKNKIIDLTILNASHFHKISD
jgi:uncharacterized protein YuzE